MNQLPIDANPVLREVRNSLTILLSDTSLFWMGRASPCKRRAWDAPPDEGNHGFARSRERFIMVTRKFKRYQVSMPSTLVHKDQFRHKGSIRDLSTKGCRVESLLSPFTGMQVTLLLHVPGEAKPITIENAAIRWCGSQGIGMEFLVVAKPEEDRLGRIIQQLEARVSPR